MKGVKGILLMAGQGERFGTPLPKQFHLLGHAPVYQWTLNRLVSSELFEEILLVCTPEKVEEVQEEVGQTARVIPGGVTRQESSYLGLLACGSTTEIVLIHDAVRPFVSQKILVKNLEAAQLFGTADTCIPSRDTLVYAPNGESIEAIPERSCYLRGQTPQSFSYPLILEAHEKTHSTSATDDCQLVLSLGKPVRIVEGEEENFKITTPLDLALAEEQIKQERLIF